MSIDEGIDYICFSDSHIENSGIWKVFPIPEDLRYISKVKQQRIIKICPHRYLPAGYDVSIWVDGNIIIKGGLKKLIAEYDLEKMPLYTRIHPTRDCIYDEADAVLRLGKDTSGLVQTQIARYRNEHYPHHVGMAETCVLLRRHNDPACAKFDDAWGIELLTNSHRDQLSFNYVCWKTGFLPGYMTNQFRINDNEYFGFRKHGN